MAKCKTQRQPWRTLLTHRMSQHRQAAELDIALIVGVMEVADVETLVVAALVQVKVDKAVDVVVMENAGVTVPQEVPIFVVS